MKSLDKLLSIFLVIVSLAVSIAFSIVATERALTTLEGVLLQAFSLGAGLIGSYLFGRISTQEAAMEIVKPHARTAFRRLWSLYESLSRVASTISDAERTESPTEVDYRITLARLNAIATEQIISADDAMEDWHDIIPQELEELRERSKKYKAAAAPS